MTKSILDYFAGSTCETTAKSTTQLVVSKKRANHLFVRYQPPTNNNF